MIEAAFQVVFVEVRWMLVLVVYDIADDKRRLKLSNFWRVMAGEFRRACLSVLFRWRR